MPKRSTAADGSTTVRGKRSNGAGSIYFDKANDCYFATWRDGDGKLRKVRGKTQAEATSVVVTRRSRSGSPRPDPGAHGSRRRRPCPSWASGGSSTLRRIACARRRSARSASASPGPASLNSPTCRSTQLSSEQVQEWQSGLMRGRYGLSPSTVADTRVTLNQVLECAIDHRLIAVNPAKRVKPPRVPKSHGRHLDGADAQRLVAACSGARYGAVVAMLFMQGWRVSEVLGLAWSDLDLDAKEPTATVRRAMIQATGVGRVLGPPKSEGAEGRHYLLPGVVDRLRAQRAVQAAERLAAGPAWQIHHYEGQRVDLVFTTEDGGLVARQHIDKLIRSTAEGLGIDTTGLGTHVGRRSVVTAMSEDGIPLDDIARHVGHASATTTAGYVRSHAARDKATAKRAVSILDIPAV